MVVPPAGIPLATETDPELAALPAPRRPWRLATLISLGVLFFASLFVAGQALPLAEYALASDQPTDIGPLETLEPQRRHKNRWVHATGQLSSKVAGYRRPMEGDRFRVAPVEGRDDIWVEVREPALAAGESYIAPDSFVGRLVPIRDPGLRHRGVLAALRASGQPLPAPDAWLLIDGDSPGTSRWAIGLVFLLTGFALFSAWGMVTLLRPVRR